MKNRNALDKLRVASHQGVKERDYWLKKMAGEPVKTHFPYDYKPGEWQRIMNSVEFNFTGNIFDRLMHLSNNYDYTLYMVLAAVLKVLLRKHTAAEDIIVGAPIYKQEVEENFINTVLAFRDRLTPPMTFKELLLQVKTTIVEANENQNYPIELLLEHLNMSLPGKDFPLFDIAVLLENIHEKRYALHIPLNMLFSFKRKDTCIEGKLEYNANLYRQSTIERIISHFMHGVEETLTNIEVKIDDINILSEQEQKQLLYDFNDTEAEYPSDKTIHELFAEQAARTPDSAAVVGHGCMNAWLHEEIIITYRELNKRSKRLAHLLKEKGVLADSIVGIMVHRSVEMITGILGILKAGGAYLPIDQDYPQERIDYMLKDSGAKILLATESTEVFSVSSVSSVASSNLAYIIYTSGSTGRPKGVMIEHRTLVNLCYWHNRYYEVGGRDKAAQYAGVSFDASVWEIFPYLIGGASIHIIGAEIRLDIGQLGRYYEKHHITVGFLPTQICEQFMMQKIKTGSLRKLLTGGDKLRVFHRDKYELYNNYGPTENTVVTTSFAVDGNYENIPIGKPISNIRVYILDKNNKLQPIGIPGELYISGAGLARGYLNHPELTAEKFIPVSYRSYRFYRSYIFYKTGDLARWLPDGNIEFLGRIDNQVKIRGYRIETGEIENYLLKHKAVKEVLVMTMDYESGEKYLCAYIVPVSPAHRRSFPVSRLKEYLSGKLPGYMVPAHFVILEKMPLTPNGKVDRKTLPVPGIGKSGAVYIAPRDEIEKKLAKIWSETLEIEKEQVGIDDDFFSLGGHSLKANYAAAKIYKTFDIKLPLAEVFENPTIRELAGLIKKAKTGKYEPIEPAEEKEYYVLTPAQKRLYILQQMELESTAYNLPYVLPLKEDVNRERLEKAVRKLISRHESLRTSFEMKGNEPVQRIHRENSKFQITNITGNFVQSFDLSKTPLLRLGLIKTEEARHLLMVDMHHIITDGTSQGILTGELMALYSHPGKELPPLPLQYKDYAEWQNSRKQQELIARQEIYWLELFSDDLPVLNLPFDYPRPVLQSFAGSRIRFVLNEEETKHLKSMARENDSTLYMTILSVFSILLSRLSGEEDIIVGTPIAGRQHPDTEKLIGMFVNTLAMRNYPGGDKTFKEFLGEVKKHTLAAYENQGYPFDQLVEKIPVHRDTSRNPVFDVMFNLLNQADYTGGISLVDEDSEAYTYHENVTAKFDLNLTAVDLEETLSFSLEYCTKLFKKETVERFIKYFKRLAASVIANPDQRLSEPEILPEEEKAGILRILSGETEIFDNSRTIQRMFEEIVEKGPENTALVLGENQLTYEELNMKANQLAWALRLKGITPDAVVGLMVERSIEMIIGVLAILKAGGACLPIDTDYPQERKKYMIEDSSVKVLLTNCDIQSISMDLPGDTGVIDINDKRIYRGEKANVRNIGKGSDLLYVIYTSGSTGTPKGVMLEHRNLINLIRYQYNYTNIDFTRVLQFTTISFDVSFQEIFSTLLAGGELYLITKETRDNIPGLFGFIEENEIKTLFLAAGFLKFVFTVEEYINIFPRGIAHLVTAGEQVVVNDRFKKYLKENHVFLHNHYGPSETHVVTTLTVDPSGEIPHLPSIGRPILNTHIYILDKYYRLLPTGVSGELYIGGIQVGRGYSNQPELTAEKFLSVFYRSYRSYISKKIYKTGDLARWLPDGNIEFLGRMDHQVKIRGFRIELGEIESQLLKREEIKETVVLAKDREDGEKYLCAYIVTGDRDDPGEASYASELREYLNRRLPGYMVPSFFMKLDQMPLTFNGKINLKALPVPVFKDDTQKYTAPRDQVERKLVEIWSEVLNIDKYAVGIDENFFESGGHSLRATILVSKIHKEFDIKVPLAEVFNLRTIRELSGYIAQSGKSKYWDIKVVEKREYYPQSSAQKRLFFLDHFEDIKTSYNMLSVLNLSGKLDRERFEKAFNTLISRHESLRTSFCLINNQPVQRVHDPGDVEFAIEFYDLATEAIGDCSPKAKLPTGFIRSFDLSRAPLLRVGLARLFKDRFRLLYDMHHIIGDGTSGGLLVKDFIRLYNGEKLSSLRIQYKDFSLWQNRLFKTGKIETQEHYWLKLFTGEIPRLHLPADYPRPGVYSYRGKTIEVIVGAREMERFNGLASANDVTLYMNLLAAFNVLLSKYTGQTDIVVGTPTVGRPHASLHHIVGMFVNMLAMRNYPENDKTYREFLKEVKENSLNAFENQDVQFESLVEQLNIERDVSRNPLFGVSLVVQNFERVKREVKGISITPYEIENQTTRFDLSIHVWERSDSDEIRFNIIYYRDLFKEETIHRLVRHYFNIIRQVGWTPGITLSEIDILTTEEKRLLIYDFNHTHTDYPAGKTIHRLFEEQVDKNPDTAAVVFNDACITYRQLEESANRIANYLLHEKQVRLNDRVGILMDRSIDLIAALLGILKAGAAYVPIDRAYPEERTRNIMDDAGIGVVISCKKYIRLLNRLQWECPAFHTFLCMDGTDIHAEMDVRESEVMNQKKIWEYVGENAVDEITGGGWNTSFTSEPFSKEEMDEYGDNILNKLTPFLHKKMRVLEIGCASGITMYRIAPGVGFYYGTDLSAVIIEKNKERVRQEGHHNIALAALPAHEIDGLAEKDFDLVILNSVVQSFYGHNYLRIVLRKCIRLMKAEGYLFVGDVMDHSRKKDLIADLAVFRQADRDKKYRTKTDFSSTLFVHKQFFEDLSVEIPGIRAVEFSRKIYTIENELTRYRYDALIKIDKKQTRDGKNKHKYQDDLRTLENCGTTGVRAGAGAGTLAYIIYTSGSTGVPKGVLISHSNVVNIVSWFARQYRLGKGVHVLQMSNYAFDASVNQIFGTLLHGASLYVVDSETLGDIGLLRRYINVHCIHILNFVPVMLKELLCDFPRLGSVQAVISGGERLEDAVKNRMREAGYAVYNQYGPTEATIDALMDKCSGETVTLGKPVSNARCYILDKNQTPTPLGVVGELYIGGAGLARGYLNQPELTAEKFLSVFYRSYRSYRSYISKKIYKTGDLARWLSNGKIAFCGRVDSQVKVRGFRIELEEIENILKNNDTIKDAVVTAREEKGNSYICAYLVPVVPAVQEAGQVEKIKEYLSLRLPGYMIPSYFVWLDKMPLCAGGKVDRRMLPEPGVRTGDNYASPRDELEKKLQDIWREVLAKDASDGSPGIDDNFFELGGHSLKATILNSQIYRELKVKLPLAAIFGNPSIRGLAAVISKSGAAVFHEIPPAEVREYYPLSYNQSRLFLLQQMEPESPAFHMPGYVDLKHEVDQNVIKRVLDRLIQRHENFRTAFIVVEDRPFQVVLKNVKMSFEFIDLSAVNLEFAEKEQACDRVYRRIAGELFDLFTPPLFRAALVKLAPSNYRFMFNMHHIVSDGWSMEILKKEFNQLYEIYRSDREMELPALSIQYKDFALWQNRQMHGLEGKKSLQFWRKKIEQGLPGLLLRKDSQETGDSLDSGGYRFALEKEVKEKLKQVALDNSTGIFTAMYAVLNIMLSRLSNQSDVVTGILGAGRNHDTLQNIMGFFVNTLVMKNHVEEREYFPVFLSRVHRDMLEILQHQDYPLESVFEDLGMRFPDIPLLFNMFSLSERASEQELAAFEFEPSHIENVQDVKFEIVIFVTEYKNGIRVDCRYRKAVYKKERIEYMMRKYMEVLRTAAADPGKPIKEYMFKEKRKKRKVRLN